MNDSLYIVGSEPIDEWECRNGFPSSIIMSGDASADTFISLAHDFDYTKYQSISFENLTVRNYLYDSGYDCAFEEYLESCVCNDAIRLPVLMKIFLNTSYMTDFVVSDLCVFSADYKMLVHIPEAESVAIPEYVERVGIGACCGYEDMSVLYLCDGLKSIGKWAFVAAGITLLDMPDTVVVLGEKVFLMSGLEKVRLSNSLESLPDGCFKLCSLVEIHLPKSLKSIGNEVFSGHLLLGEIDIPEGVEQIGSDVFEEILRVSLPSTLREIATDFYYERCVDDSRYPPYITVHPENKKFVSIDGSLYFRESGALAVDSKYKGPNALRAVCRSRR